MSSIYHPWGMSGQPAAPPPHAFSSSGMGAAPRKRYYTLTEWSLMHGGTGMSGIAVGMGQTGQSIAVSTPQIVGGTLTTGIVATTAAHGAGATFLGLTAAAIPIIGAVVAGVTLGLMAIFSRKGPRQKVATTQIVDKVEPLLKQNLEGYLAGPHTVSSQQQALNNFDAGWKYVVDNCGISEMGDPGQWCINDRKAGACKWKDAQGKCWNWFVGYRQPIADDPNVKPDPVVDSVTGGLVDTLTGKAFGAAGGGGGLLLLAGLAIAGVVLMGGSKK